MGSCQGFSTCYGYNCGGGAVEQTAIGYANAEGPHPKCGIPPMTFGFEISGWHGSLEMLTGSIDEIFQQNIGCQHSNCICQGSQCQCFRTDMGGNTNFAGHMSARDCQAQGRCISPDMTVQGCCEDPITGQKPIVKTGFEDGLNQTECECRGGSWSTWCKPWTQDQLDECNQCKSTCHPFKVLTGSNTWEYNQDCAGGSVKVDADGVLCCCPLDRPKCDYCPHQCVVWQGHTTEYCGPPVLFCDDDICGPEGTSSNRGYGVTIPWEMTLVCAGPALVAHGHLADPQDFGKWYLHLVAYKPDPANILGTDICKEWTFSNIHGVGDLDMGKVCLDGQWTITVEVPVGSSEIKTSCSCACPCQQNVTHVFEGETCVCRDSQPPNPDCELADDFVCIEGSTDPPDCDASCWVPIPACPGADSLWDTLSADPNSLTPVDRYCNSGSRSEIGSDGVERWFKGELMGSHKFDEEKCGICCEVCDEFCADQCVCEKVQAIVGPSSQCGIATGSYRNIDGHGCSKAPKPTFEGTAKEGQCCVGGYGTPSGEGEERCEIINGIEVCGHIGPLNTGCIEESYYECGCLSEDNAKAGTVTLRITANAQMGPTITPDAEADRDAFGETMNECGAVDAICDLSNKSPTTDGCVYTKWPDAGGCVSPLPYPDHTEGVRCPNSLVWEQPTYGYQCTLLGGSSNHSMADFPIKPAGLCLNARAERWHLRPQFLFPHLWAICYKGGGICAQPADRDAQCVEHPEVNKYIADLGHTHGMIGECNIYCVGWWEVVVDCFRAWTLDLCEGCSCSCCEDNKLMGAPEYGGGHCLKRDQSLDWGCDGRWPGIFPFLYYHPPEDVFCPQGEYFPAISCPTVPGSPAADILGQAGQVYYPGNIETKWTGCCGNQPEGCECCYPCGHPAWDPTCRIRNLISGNICDICFECMCESSRSEEGGTANQVYKSNDCPNGCEQAVPQITTPIVTPILPPVTTSAFSSNNPAPRSDVSCVPPGGMDVVFAIDITGSMVAKISALKRGVEQYTDWVKETSGDNYRLGLVTFKEHPFETKWVTDLSDSNTESFKEGLAPLVAQGGGDMEEAHVDAVRSILNEEGGSWSEDRGKGYAKVIIVMTDTEPNEGDAAAALLADRAKEEGVIISAILFTPTSVDQERAEVSLRNYASVTGGAFIVAPAGAATSAILDGLMVSCGLAAWGSIPSPGQAGLAASATGQCVQVVQDGGSEVAGCGQFMQERPDGECPAPIYCPEGQIPHDKYGGGYCHEGDFCCHCLREKDHWQLNPPLFDGPTTNQLGWRLGAPVLYDMAWYPLKEAVCMLEPCGMGESSEGEIPGSPGGDPAFLWDKGTIKVSVTLMRPGTSTEVGESIDIYDHQSTGEIIGVTGKEEPIKITSRLQVGQLEINLAPGDPIFIGEMTDTQGMPFGSKVGGNLAANGQFRVLAVSGNEFTIALPGAGPVIGDGDWTDGGTWHYYDPNDSGAGCTAPDQQCAFDFEFIQGGANVGTSPKLLPESLFIECVEEAFTEWSNILESLWSPRADYAAVDRRHGSWGGGTDLFPGSHNRNPGFGQTNSHQLRVRFINLGHEAALNNEVPSNKTDRYFVPQWSDNTNWPMVGRCVTRLPGGDVARGVVPERKWENMASCITNGHCYAQGCSANDTRSTSYQLSSSNKCEEMSHTGAGIVANNAKDCLSTKYYACLTNPYIKVVTLRSADEFGDPVDSDLDGEADLFPVVPQRQYLDPKYVREDIGDEACCNHVDGYWELIPGDWSSDFGNGGGIFEPGFSELFPCLPKNAECCQGTNSCVTPGGDPFILPTNTYVPSSCCKEYEKLYGQCLGKRFQQGAAGVVIWEELPGCGYDCCAFGFAGWCVDQSNFNNVYWSSASCPGCGGSKACNEGTASVGCTETFDTGGASLASVQWQATQRVLSNNIGATGGIGVSLRFPGGNVGDPLERTDCDNATSELFKVGDYIKIGREYMEVTRINTATNGLSVRRSVSIPDANPRHGGGGLHSRGDSIYLWSHNVGGCLPPPQADLCKNCSDVCHCVDNDGNLIGDANNGIGYFPIDNRSLYHLCRDGNRISPFPNACGAGGGCYIAGEGDTGSSRGVPIGISSLYGRIDSTQMRITVTEIDNTGNLFVDAGNDTHDPSIIATPEEFKLKTGDIIRIEEENMRVVTIRETDQFHASVKGHCTGDVNLNGLPGTWQDPPGCEFTSCNPALSDPLSATDCRHWNAASFDNAIGWSNCIGEPLGNRSWPYKIVALYEITVTRGEDGTSAVEHEANKWVRKKYGDIINDCRQCEDNLGGVSHRYEWIGSGGGSSTQPPMPSNPAGSLWFPAAWYPKFDWVANIWEAKVEHDTPFYGKTGAACEDWPDKDSCCPRPGQVRIGMVNWYDALRERWAQEGKGQCYDCNTGVIVGNQTIFGPNSVELHGECLRYDEDKYNKLLIGSTSASQADCLALNCGAVNDCDGVCSDTSYTIKTGCISNNKIWATWDWSAYVNKDICSNAGHCWDYRDPPLVPASGNPFACGYMGNTMCRQQTPDGIWIDCIPAAGRPYGLSNNMIGVPREVELQYDNYGKNCKGFRPNFGSNVVPATPGGGEPGGTFVDQNRGGEACKCITLGREGIAGDLYIDSSVRWRPDWVDESDKPGAYSIKRVLMKQIGHMLGLPEGGDLMSPIGGPADNAITVGFSTYNQLVRMYEPRWWNRGGRNDYWWHSGVYAGDFK